MNEILRGLVSRIVKPGNAFSTTEHEPIVFGARRPGFPLPLVPQVIVDEWIAFMTAQGIKRVVCLLPKHQLSSYDDLLGSYRNGTKLSAIASCSSSFQLATEFGTRLLH